MGASSFMSAPTISEDCVAILIIFIVSSQNKPPGSGVPVAGIMLESKPSTSKVMYTFLLLIIFLNLLKFHFDLSFAQKIFILFLFLFKKGISLEEIFRIPNDITFKFLFFFYFFLKMVFHLKKYFLYQTKPD